MKNHFKDGIGKEPDSSERLDGWKEIAVFLKRDVRTVRRWEKQEDLPIHRHVHEKRASVYAYGAELSAWWNNRHDHLEELQRTQQSRLRRNLPRAVGLATIILLALLAWLIQARWGVRTPGALEFQERDWVLITDFDNHTGESLFDGALKYALAQELGSSPYVNVIPQSRVEDVLQLMKKPLDTRVDGDLAREICLRDGGIKAFVTGEVEKLGSTYVISAALAAVPDGRIVTSHTEETQDSDQVWPAIRSLSRWARSALGEALPLIQQNSAELEEVTTPSLKALELFSKGDSLHHRGMYKAAAELYKQALDEDPNFAAAHMWLAFVLRNQGLPRKDWLPHVERAVELCDSATEAERYIILGKSHYILGNLEEALPYYEALLQFDPDHYWGLDTLRTIYLVTGRPEQAADLAVHAASLRPNDFFTHLSTTRILAAHIGLTAAKPYAERAANLITEEIRRRAAYACAWLRLFPAHVYWAEGDYERSLSELEGHIDRLETLDDPSKGNLGENCSLIYMALGKLQAVKQLAKMLPQPYQERVITGLALFTDDYGLLDPVVKYRDEPSPRHDLIIAVARAGHVPEAQRLFSLWKERRNSSRLNALQKTLLGIMEAELALAEGNKAEGLKLLQHHLRVYETLSVTVPRATYYLGCESLARILEQQGDREEALQVMQNASRQEWQNPFPAGPVPWIKHQWLLASLYRRLGEDQIAKEIEAKLLKMLTHADADHPMLLEIKAREEAGGPEA